MGWSGVGWHRASDGVYRAAAASSRWLANMTSAVDTRKAASPTKLSPALP